MIRKKIGHGLAVLLLCCLLLLSGCNKLTKENYGKLKAGMPYDEVVGILGEDVSCDGALGAKSCTWGDETKNIKIKFVADKVVFMSHKGL